jgi:hypothetical protein
VTGIPDGMEVYSERIKIALHAADGSDWNTALETYNVIQNQALETEASYRRLPGKGEPYWLTANIDKSFYHEHGVEPVHLHATVALAMLGRAQTTTVDRWGEPQADRRRRRLRDSRSTSRRSGCFVSRRCENLRSP